MRAFFLCLLSFAAACSDPDDDGRITTPACASSAPLVVPNAGSPTDSYLVELDKGTTDAAMDALAARHDVVIETRLPIVFAFSATLHPNTVAALRCEPLVARITENRRQNAAASE
jgi:hypothetical protein